MSLKVSPVSRYDIPNLPTRRILDEHPELLALVPRRWQRNPVVLTALTVVCILSLNSRSRSEETLDLSAVSRVAPVFEHGEGRVTYCCVAANPPVFLSESEAREVIVEEAKRAGIEFERHVWMLPHVPIPLKTASGEKTEGEDAGKTTEKEAVQTLGIRLDGTDKKRRIAYEYVSSSDLAAWHMVSGSGLSTTFDTLDGAKRLRQGLVKDEPAGAYAVFYAPCAPRSASGSKLKAKEADREELRKQVQDFIKWLKAQGVI